jgi:Flp pilus assembly protein TadG
MTAPRPLRKLGRQLRRSERGQSLVEFAMVLPLFLIIVFGIVDFGRAYSAYVQLNNGAREGARYGAVGKSSSEIQARVRAVTSGLNQGDLAISVSGAQGTKGSTITVSTVYDFDFITPIGSFIAGLGSSFNLDASSQMRIESD